MVPSFDDRTLTLDAPEQLAAIGGVFASRTRLAVLAALVSSQTPLNINELARRVGVDASPVRGHLELLLKEGLVREVATASGRERRFDTLLTNVRLTLEGVDRTVIPGKGAPVRKAAARIQKKIDAVANDIGKLEEKARRYKEELQEELSTDIS